MPVSFSSRGKKLPERNKRPSCNLRQYGTYIHTNIHIYSTCNNCNMGMRALPDVYARLPEGIHIRESPNAPCYS